MDSPNWYEEEYKARLRSEQGLPPLKEYHVTELVTCEQLANKALSILEALNSDGVWK
jgi:hypothetical protein